MSQAKGMKKFHEEATACARTKRAQNMFQMAGTEHRGTYKTREVKILCRVFSATSRLFFIPRAVGSHWRVLNKRAI